MEGVKNKKEERDHEFLLRIDPKLFDKVDDLVHKRKKKSRAYSINKYIIQLIEKDLKEGSNK